MFLISHIAGHFIFFQTPNMLERNATVGMQDVSPSANNFVCEISLEDPTSVSSEISSSQKSPDVPDFANTSMETLERMAGLSDHDRFIFSWLKLIFNKKFRQT